LTVMAANNSSSSSNMAAAESVNPRRRLPKVRCDQLNNKVLNDSVSFLTCDTM
jgi:hypothetical protein